jgi:ferredoxin
LKIHVDLLLCQGHGQCEESAPEVFVVGDDAVVHLLMDDPPEAMRPAVEEAVRRCPVDALRLDDDI